jgi:hypothetical protein
VSMVRGSGFGIGVWNLGFRVKGTRFGTKGTLLLRRVASSFAAVAVAFGV